MSDPEAWLLDWFDRQGAVNGTPPSELVALDYLDAGLLDSLQVVTLIQAVEDELGVRLEADDLADPSFRTIRGLAGLVARRP